jgi:hypothetical protein
MGWLNGHRSPCRQADLGTALKPIEWAKRRESTASESLSAAHPGDCGERWSGRPGLPPKCPGLGPHPSRRSPGKEVTPTDRLSGFGTGLATNSDSVERVPRGHLSRYSDPNSSACIFS